MNDHTACPSTSDDDTLRQAPEPTPRPRSLLNLLLDRTRIDDAVEYHEYPGKGTVEEPYIVSFIPDDAGNPFNWSKLARWRITMVSAATCFAVAFSSSAYTGTMKELMFHFRASNTLITGGVSLYVLGFALGPLLWAPLSEIYGRQIVFFISYGLYRSIAMGLFSLAPAMGPTLGPFIGGYLGEDEGWRWVMGLMGIIAGAFWLLGIFLVPETYGPLILKNRAQVLSEKTGKCYISEYDHAGKADPPAVVLKKALIRPWLLLFVEPIVLILSIYTAIVYGTLYMLFGAYPVVFQLERGWSAGKGGLAFLGVAVGMFSAVPTVSLINLWYMKITKAAKGGVVPPEYRLPGSMIGGICVPVGMFWFAWTSYTDIHWMSPVAAGIPFGLGMTLIFHSIFNYLIDAYAIYAASVLAANTVLRSLFGAAFPLFTKQMYDKLGTQWASSVPAFLALACLPMPFILWKYGPAIRSRCKYSAKAATATGSQETKG
ncbi:uncharacterized protein NECHADRAFT_52650 [Fusarium vanettenii 77-13-4]|uniref:Major facilitator superfamily (MFS) profile domain-containing protein n=1 Tax=Fusarium vanettenii (strain ATCC MYA-4622 / CBS 123669 / FGSC 9596 / NRRL 45880 / 77-13-4) TaxID=660122 RepID=C7ZHW7_FUSV7|nr:uncharacterized protein NECHADRAFT_52650 [Fusarium vanettenii 77-13-4]EEU36354.1 hypothetical protein NECHADRAFT_52650 [Fusarium vanettenii 77-13-4]